jgi:hypothetical protein
MNDRVMKEQAEKQAKCATGMLGSTSTPYGMSFDEPCRASLRERVAMDLRRSQKEADKRDRLAELDMLLDKHSEIARILDLLEDVRR